MHVFLAYNKLRRRASSILLLVGLFLWILFHWVLNVGRGFNPRFATKWQVMMLSISFQCRKGSSISMDIRSPRFFRGNSVWFRIFLVWLLTVSRMLSLLEFLWEIRVWRGQSSLDNFCMVATNRKLQRILFLEGTFGQKMKVIAHAALSSWLAWSVWKKTREQETVWYQGPIQSKSVSDRPCRLQAMSKNTVAYMLILGAIQSPLQRSMTDHRYQSVCPRCILWESTLGSLVGVFRQWGYCWPKNADDLALCTAFLKGMKDFAYDGFVVYALGAGQHTKSRNLQVHLELDIISDSGTKGVGHQGFSAVERPPRARHSMLRPRPSMPLLEKFNCRQFMELSICLLIFFQQIELSM